MTSATPPMCCGPVFERTRGLDGFVSLEVSPYLALRTEETIAEARRLWKWVERPNLMVKVPGTAQGAPSVRILIEDGININVTLLFALSAYQAVAEAYMVGLEARVARVWTFRAYPASRVSSSAASMRRSTRRSTSAWRRATRRPTR